MSKIYLLILFFLSLEVSAGNYYFSLAGNDANTGTTTADPFQTIMKLNTLTLAPGDSVLFRAGDTFRGQINLHQGGSSGSPIVFSQYNSGRKPVISGAVPLNRWDTAAGKFIDTIHTQVRNLFIDDVEMPLARYPNSGFLKLDSASATIIYESQLSDPAGYWDGAKICIRTSQWSWEKSAVATYTPGQITLTTPVTLNAPDGYGYFFYDFENALDTSFEWVYDTTNDVVKLIMPPGDTPSLHTCEASIFGAGIRIFPGLSYISIRNLVFEKQFQAGVVIADSSNQNVIIGNCGFNRQYNYGVQVNGSNHIIQNCSFREIDGHAVDVSNGKLVRVHHNTFRRIGQYRSSGIGGQTNFSAIALNFTDSCMIDHNSIDSTGYCGISADGTHHLVERNIVSHAMMLLNDGAPIKTFGAGSHDIIFRNNIVSASNGNTAGAFRATFQTPGYYFDLDAHHCSLLNNTVYNQTPKGIFQNGGSHDNVIRGNVVYGSTLLIDLNGAQGGSGISNDTIEHNVFFARDTSAYILRETSQSASFAFGYLDSNYYFNPYDSSRIAYRIQSSSRTNYSLYDWQTLTGNDLATKGSFVHWATGIDSSRIYINPTDSVDSVNLGNSVFLDLDSQQVCGTLVLQPYTSQVLILTGEACTTGLTEQDEIPAFEVYPVPATEEVFVNGTCPKGSGIALLLYDAFGKLVDEKKVSAGNFSEVFDVRTLSPGIYILVMGQSFQKIVIFR